MDCNLPGSSVHGIFQTRTFWYWFPFPEPGIEPVSPSWQADSLQLSHQEILKVKVLVSQSCVTLYDPVDYNRPGFSVHGILQAGILEWITIFFSRGSSQARDRTQVSCIADEFFTTEPQETLQVHKFCTGS